MERRPQFVEEVERIWTTNPLWYGICHGDAGAVEGFWGTIYEPGDPRRKMTHFLGHTQSEVLPHMKALDPRHLNKSGDPKRSHSTHESLRPLSSPIWTWDSLLDNQL